MIEIFKVFGTIGLNSQEANKGLDDLDQKGQQTSNNLSGNFEKASAAANRMGSASTQLGTGLTTLTAPILGIGVAALKSGGEFEASMNSVQALTKATEVEFESLQQLALKMGSTTAHSASQAADGMGFLAQAGFETDEIMQALPGVLQLASAGNIGLAEAADKASNVLSGFGLKADQINRVNNAMAATAANANTDILQLANGLSFAAPVAAGFGVDIETTVAAMGKLSDAGIQSTRAGTSFSQIMVLMADRADKLGVEVFKGGKAIESYSEALGTIQQNGADTNEVLEALQQVAANVGHEFTTAELATDEGMVAALTAIKEEGFSAEQALEQFGNTVGGSVISLVNAAEGEMRDFPTLLTEIQEQGLTASEIMDIFGQRAGPAMLALLSTTRPEIESYSDALSVINQNGGEAEVALEALLTVANEAGAGLDSINDDVGIVTALEAIKEEGFDAEQIMERFGQRVGSDLVSLLAAGGNGVADLRKEVTGTNAAAELAEAKMKGFQGSLKLLSSAFEGLAIAIADSGLLEFVTNMVTKLAGFLGKLSETNPMLLKIGVAIGAILGVAGPLLIIVGQMITAFGAITGALAVFTGGAGAAAGAGAAVSASLGAILIPIATIIAAIGALVLAWKNNFGNIRDVTENTIGRIKEVFGDSFARISAVWTETLQPALQSLGEMLGFIGGEVEGVNVWSTIFEAVFMTIADVVVFAVEVITNIVATMVETFANTIGFITALMQGDFGEAFSIALDSVKSFVNLVGGLITSFVGLFSESGANAVQGFIDGILGKLEAARETVVNFGRRIMGWFRGSLGEESPSKEFAQSGVNSALGYIQGLTSMHGEVSEAAKKTAQAAIKSFEQELKDINVQLQIGALDEGQAREKLVAIRDTLKETIDEMVRAGTDAGPVFTGLADKFIQVKGSIEQIDQAVAQLAEEDKRLATEMIANGDLTVSERITQLESLVSSSQTSASQIEVIEKELNERRKELSEELKAISQAEFDKRKALGEVSLQDELARLEEQLAAFEGTTQARLQLETQIINKRTEVNNALKALDQAEFDFRKLKGEESLESELARKQKELSAIQEHNLEKLALATEVFNLEQAIKDRDIELEQARFEAKKQLGLTTLEDELANLEKQLEQNRS